MLTIHAITSGTDIWGCCSHHSEDLTGLHTSAVLAPLPGTSTVCSRDRGPTAQGGTATASALQESCSTPHVPTPGAQQC